MHLPVVPFPILQERPRSLNFLSVVREGLDDLTFEPPAEWSQRTIVGFNAPHPEDYAYPPGVIVMRDTMADHDTLEAIVERHLTELLQLPEVQIATPHTFELDGQPAVEIEYEWTSETCVLAQTTTIVTSCTAMRRTITTFTTFCATEDTPALRPVFAKMFASVSFAPRYAVSKSDVAPKPSESEATLVTITSVLNIEDPFPFNVDESFREAYGESFNLAPVLPREPPRVEIRPPARLTPPPPKPTEDMNIPEVPIPGTRVPRTDP
jgi:hypothetical protein